MKEKNRRLLLLVFAVNTAPAVRGTGHDVYSDSFKPNIHLMNLNFTITLTLLQMILLVTMIMGAAFSIKLRNLYKTRKRINELENEMLICHREILQLQQSKNLQHQNENAERKEGKLLALKHG